MKLQLIIKADREVHNPTLHGLPLGAQQTCREKQRESSSLTEVKIVTTKQLSSSTSPQDFRQQQLLINVKTGSFSILGHRRVFLK